MPNHWQGITSTTFIAHGSMTWRLCKWLRLFLHGYIYMFAHVLLCLRPGLLYSIKQCLRLTKNSLCWFGIPCSMLVFISLGTSLREVDGHSIMGDESQPAVQQSNMMLSRSAMLVLLCHGKAGVLGCRTALNFKIGQDPLLPHAFGVKAGGNSFHQVVGFSVFVHSHESSVLAALFALSWH